MTTPHHTRYISLDQSAENPSQRVNVTSSPATAVVWHVAWLLVGSSLVD